VKWWNTLHQGASISVSKAPTMAATMFLGLMLMTFAFWAYTFAAVFARTRAIVLEQEGNRDWAAAVAAPTTPTRSAA
jgi:heme exporter protein C